MEKDYQNNNSISDAANNNEESNKPEHEIKVEIVSIEVVGEDTPPKHSHHGICRMKVKNKPWHSLNYTPHMPQNICPHISTL